MGREVRRVPPNWEHPKRGDGREGYQPMFDQSFKDAAQDWKDGYEAWKESPQSDCEYWEWHCTPDPEDYRVEDWTPEEATHYQLYETVSEGTPVTPSFPTLEGLASYLSENGDYWYQSDVAKGKRTFRTKPSYDEAFAMVTAGFSFSMAVIGEQILDAYQQHRPQEPPQ